MKRWHGGEVLAVPAVPVFGPVGLILDCQIRVTIDKGICQISLKLKLGGSCAIDGCLVRCCDGVFTVGQTPSLLQPNLWKLWVQSFHTKSCSIFLCKQYGETYLTVLNWYGWLNMLHTVKDLPFCKYIFFSNRFRASSLDWTQENPEHSGFLQMFRFFLG